MRPIEGVYEKAKGLKIPLAVHFDLTYRCHHRCVHCYIPQAWRQGKGPGPELNTREILDVLDQLAATGAFFLTFSGGEVFLRPDLMTILECARRLDFSVTLFSSGTVGLEEEKIQALAAVGIEALIFSIYSVSASVHDRITGRPGSWDSMWRTIRKCRDRGVPVGFNVTAFICNYGEIKAIKDFIQREALFCRVGTCITPRWDGQSHPLGLALGGEELSHLEAVMREEQEAMAPELHSPPRAGKINNQCGVGLNSIYLSPPGRGLALHRSSYQMRPFEKREV